MGLARGGNYAAASQIRYMPIRFCNAFCPRPRSFNYAAARPDLLPAPFLYAAVLEAKLYSDFFGAYLPAPLLHALFRGYGGDVQSRHGLAQVLGYLG